MQFRSRRYLKTRERPYALYSFNVRLIGTGCISQCGSRSLTDVSSRVSLLQETDDCRSRCSWVCFPQVLSQVYQVSESQATRERLVSVLSHHNLHSWRAFFFFCLHYVCLPVKGMQWLFLPSQRHAIDVSTESKACNGCFYRGNHRASCHCLRSSKLCQNRQRKYNAKATTSFCKASFYSSHL